MCMAQPDIPDPPPPPPEPMEETVDAPESGLTLRKKRRKTTGTAAPSLVIQRPNINIPG